MPSVYNGEKTVKQSEIMPCPFCNQQNFTLYTNGEEKKDLRYYLHCDYCDSTGPASVSSDAALKAWEHNRKPCPHWYNIDPKNLDQPAQNRCNHPDAGKW